MTHQLVRHRLMAVSQQSRRDVDEERFSYVVPPGVPPEHWEGFHRDMRTIQEVYRKWRGRGLKEEDARFVLPNACVSGIVMSADRRQWRHIFQLRLSRKAQGEIRRACELMLVVLRQHARGCFEDVQSLTATEDR